MRYTVYFSGSVWKTDAIEFQADGTVVFEAQAEDGKFKIRLKTYDIIAEQISNISVPLNVVKP